MIIENDENCFSHFSKFLSDGPKIASFVWQKAQNPIIFQPTLTKHKENEYLIIEKLESFCICA